MNILIIGSGGREHALGWKLVQSPRVTRIYFAPGNAGTLGIGENVALDLHDHSLVIDWVKNNRIDLVIIGPDEYLAAGLSDDLIKGKIKVFGPTRAAAEIEWSKSFAKQLMVEEGIPTADFKKFSNISEAKKYVEKRKFPLVIKADGLAAGKGVIIAENLREAKETLDEIMDQKIYGSAGETVVIEEYLCGREISIHAFCDGDHISLFPASQDHKRIYNGEKGPNTGGMGTIAPVPWVTDEHLNKIKEQILLPLVKGLKKRGRKFQGLIFPGIMITDTGPKVIEFNARFGDPETQSYMRLLSNDLLEILLACIDGKLAGLDVKWNKSFACCIVLASGGYPGNYQKGIPVVGIDRVFGKNKNYEDDIVFFHAGTKLLENSLVSDGGRVLGISAGSNDLQSALDKAYNAIRSIKFEGMQFRTDIGKKSL